MVRFRVAISYKFGEVSVEGENTKEVIESIDRLKAIGKSATRKITPSPVKITGENMHRVCVWAGSKPILI